MFSSIDKELRQQRINYVNTRWGQLYELNKEWGEKALRYLLLTNSGGAIATLSFLGASEMTLNIIGAKIALFLYIIGIVLVGISIAKQFHHMEKLFNAWKVDVEQYYNDKVAWHDLNDRDEKRAVEDWLDYAIPYTSFGCFIFGCIAGAISLFS